MKAISVVIIVSGFALAVFAASSSAQCGAEPPDMQCEHIGLGAGHGSGQGAGSGHGSGKGRGCQMPEVDDHLKVLNENLTLSDRQQGRLRILLEAQLARMDSIRRDGSIAPVEKTHRLRDLREASAAKVRELLDGDQARRFDAMRRDAAERTKERHERGEDCAMIWNVMQ